MNDRDVRISLKNRGRVRGLITNRQAAEGYDGKDHIILKECSFPMAKRLVSKSPIDVLIGEKMKQWKEINISDFKELEYTYEGYFDNEESTDTIEEVELVFHFFDSSRNDAEFYRMTKFDDINTKDLIDISSDKYLDEIRSIAESNYFIINSIKSSKYNRSTNRVEYSISCAPDPKYVAVPTNLFDTEDQVIEPVREEDVDPLEESNEPEIDLSDAMIADEKPVDNCPIESAESAIPEPEHDSSLAEATIATNEEEVNDKLESVGQPEYEIRNEEDTKVEPVASPAPSIKPVNPNNNNHNHNQYHRGGNGKNRNKK